MVSRTPLSDILLKKIMFCTPGSSKNLRQLFAAGIVKRDISSIIKI